MTDIAAVVPITYMNSSAALKAFVGRPRRGGLHLIQRPGRAHLGSGRAGQEQGAATNAAPVSGSEVKVLFFPDQHLGRNTAFQLGFGRRDMGVWDPRRDLGGLDERHVKEARFLLWKGHCSVHQRFRPEHVAAFRDAHPAGRVIVHPECSHEVVERADEVGSTDYIIASVERAPAGSVLGVATEIHLVQRLAHEHPSLQVVSLDPLICPCSTMFRIDAAHLCWVLEELVAGRVVNRITVADDVAAGARVALQRMLDIT